MALLVLHGGVNRALMSYLLTGEKRFLGGLRAGRGLHQRARRRAPAATTSMRMLNHSPLDALQTATRKTTMEILFEQYHAFRSRVKES